MAHLVVLEVNGSESLGLSNTVAEDLLDAFITQEHTADVEMHQSGGSSNKTRHVFHKLAHEFLLVSQVASPFLEPDILQQIIIVL